MEFKLNGMKLCFRNCKTRTRTGTRNGIFSPFGNKTRAATINARLTRSSFSSFKSIVPLADCERDKWSNEWMKLRAMREWEWQFRLYKSQPPINQSISWREREEKANKQTHTFWVVWQWKLSGQFHSCMYSSPTKWAICTCYNIIKLIELKRSLETRNEQVDERTSERVSVRTHTSYHISIIIWDDEMRSSIAVEWHSKFKPQIRETRYSLSRTTRQTRFKPFKCVNCDRLCNCCVWKFTVRTVRPA